MNDTIQIDADTVLRRFAEEREKRLRPEGFGQYLGLTQDMDRDPWTQRQAREPVADHVTFTFVGGGWAGLLTGAELAKRGIHDVRIIDRAGDFGGVWYWNRYPGVMCDSPAALYLPLLEETGHMPSMKYAFQPEILEHCQRIGRQFGLYDKALFHTSVERAEWDEAARLWRITTDRGDSFTSTYLSLGLGFFSTPKLPGISGIETFKGKAFHAARWDYEYTGGSPADPRLDKLADKRVAVIGTGATAIQCIGPVSETAKELYVFQRTPSAVSPRGNGPVDEAWFRSIATPGWQKRYNDAYVRDWTGLWGQPFSRTVARPAGRRFREVRCTLAVGDPLGASRDTQSRDGQGRAGQCLRRNRVGSARVHSPNGVRSRHGRKAVAVVPASLQAANLQ